MFKRLCCVVGIIFCWLTISFAEPVLYSADLTGDAQAVSGRANFYGVWIVTDGTNAVTFDIHDGTSTAGAKLIPTTVIDPAERVTQTISFSYPIPCANGIYVNITTAGTVTYKVYYTRTVK